MRLHFLVTDHARCALGNLVVRGIGQAFSDMPHHLLVPKMIPRLGDAGFEDQERLVNELHGDPERRAVDGDVRKVRKEF